MSSRTSSTPSRLDAVQQAGGAIGRADLISVPGETTGEDFPVVLVVVDDKHVTGPRLHSATFLEASRVSIFWISLTNSTGFVS